MRHFLHFLADLPHEIRHRVRLATSPGYRAAHAQVMFDYAYRAGH